MLNLLTIVSTAINADPLPQIYATNSTLQSFLTAVFGLAGVVALIIVAIGGLRLIFANGDPAAVAKARTTILYALIGLAVVISAFVIVTFILNYL